MHVLRRIVRNGNSAQVCIDRRFLVHVGWKLGDVVVVELLEDGTIWLRRPTARDYRNEAATMSAPVNLPAVSR